MMIAYCFNIGFSCAAVLIGAKSNCTLDLASARRARDCKSCREWRLGFSRASQTIRSSSSLTINEPLLYTNHASLGKIEVILKTAFFNKIISFCKSFRDLKCAFMEVEFCWKRF